ncbi:hypothetical protein JHK82_021498 [Glycine max]|uniref:Uncharacterized protein n=1 Tax=Glycine max TaxID=3847 RepID=C6SXI9_SOYBN|nr:uncharacterized protein LOC100306001 [Glycine max]ACU13962.1 unknown [Glycine max]KAG5015816.1 hypothetical protein JHK85_021952 [Glycine max]KAG5025600.1 hypothetical protein JHK86_021514 [Glycine max]KAG5136767.1 hypothetical protein JHK82_021498 [Glycine max]KAH1237348.1 hypothetical protein GmHk_08G022317 [Glycine max]|eukprot:NP_001236134.1 uncharacterized protein LOC100306001 [Glycine max]
MEVQSPAAKRHYDITMSRRTRKQQQQQQQFPVQGNEKTKSEMDDEATTPKDVHVHVTVETKSSQTNVSIADEVKEGGGESDHKSLKQLIIGDDDHKEAKKKGNNNNNNNDNNSDDHERGGKGGSRNSLGEHFTEEEKQHNLQLVRMQQNKDNLQGLKFKKLVRRYAKVLGHLMKAKRDPHLGGDAGKKPVFKLST